MSWTDEQEEKLKQLWREGKTASQIAEELGGVSRNAVIGKAHRLGLSGRPSPIKVKASRPKKVGLLDLTERMCRWPIGDPRQPGFYFCGKQAMPGLPYCAEHAAKAYQTPQRRGDAERSKAAQAAALLAQQQQQQQQGGGSGDAS